MSKLKTVLNFIARQDIYLKVASVAISLIIFSCMLPEAQEKNGRITKECLCDWEIAWLYLSFFISTFISFSILLSVLKGAINEKVGLSNLGFAYPLFGAFFFVAILAVTCPPIRFYLHCGQFISANPVYVYYCITVLIVLYMAGLDYILHKAKHFSNLRGERWKWTKTYNISVIFSFALTFAMGYFTKRQYSEELGAGLTGGAASVQLILAYLLFDTSNYTIKKGTE